MWFTFSTGWLREQARETEETNETGETKMTTLTLTTDRVRAITKSILDARNDLNAGHSNYLQGLVETTQKELGAAPRKRAKAAKLDADGIKTQLAALLKVHERCYAIVLEVCSENLPAGKEKAIELNRRSNFARTALSVVRAWIRAGNDLTTVVATKATKTSMRVEVQRSQQPGPQSIARRVEKGITELIGKVEALAAIDKAAAVHQLEGIMSKAASVLATLGGSATRDPAKSIAENIPLKTKIGTFWPAMAAS